MYRVQKRLRCDSMVSFSGSYGGKDFSVCLSVYLLFRVPVISFTRLPKIIKLGQ